MRDKLTSLQQLRATAVEAKGLIAEVAGTAAAAMEGLDAKKLDAAGAVTMAQVNAAIQEAVSGAMEETY